jgi:hypothetical protein
MEKLSDNVIKFPDRGRAMPMTQEDVTSNVNMVKYTHINETLGAVIPILFSNIEMAGFDLSVGDEDEFDHNIKDGSLIVESVRSILCKYYDMYHPFQDIAEEVFKKEDENVYSIVDSLVIEFKKTNEGNSES